ncbi:ABC transporter ATP-binding protein [Cellvibrio sp. OA-2007]|uniref:ABC transporter ATP-binding protein n=1 Tax=Cellvibrio sp. OA-2007 TaxID=529823 RepID=UPI000781A12C|nr:ABC transporter ATP-binding protein [Cellvibrio sp. OA-2007]
MLKVSNLKRAYGDFVAADSVSFSIAKGEIVGLLGHNGAGKTTVMKMLSGYLEPSAGQIVFEGKQLADHLKVLQQKIGYLPESLPVYPELSVAEYLDYAAELKGLRGRDKQQEVKRVVNATDIAAKLLAPIATLSRGYKQRVGVAQALLGKPSLLILDEPTNGLDPQQTLQMRELIRAIAKDATVILSTHIMQEVEALCDRVLMMRAGQLVLDEKLAELRTSRSLLLSSSLSADEVKQTLATITGVKAIDFLASSSAETHARIHLGEAGDVKAISAAIAKILLGSGADLYQLQAETRDLESLFREVNNNLPLQNNKEALDHAA